MSPEQLLGQLTVDDWVVADFEAGLGTVMRLADRPVDIVVVVVEPTGKSLEVGRRAAQLVAEGSLGRLLVVANRVRSDQELAQVRASFPGSEVVGVPDDPAVLAAERAGHAPLDVARQAPAVQALVALAELVGASAAGPR